MEIEGTRYSIPGDFARIEIGQEVAGLGLVVVQVTHDRVEVRQERIEREARELAAAWELSSDVPLWSGRFVDPVPDAANSAFGTHSVYNGVPRSQHSGADFASPTGTPVLAPGGGRVVLAESLYFTGGTVVIDHGLGLVSLLAHLSRIDVRVGTDVVTGAVIGLVGATGRVTGPHLHWIVRYGAVSVDPMSVFTLE